MSAYFENLLESAQMGELLLVEGGMCRYHLRRDRQLTIYEIIVTIPGMGIGSAILDTLMDIPGVKTIVAKCPADLPSNGWYERKGFYLIQKERTQSGRLLNVWQRVVEGYNLMLGYS